MKILVFDNYDSFTYNLVHLVKSIGPYEVDVCLNDQVTLEQAAAYDKIILSPGPGIPEEAGILLPLIRAFAATKSILGVCLGHQAIGQAFGAQLVNLSKVYHGVSTTIHIAEDASNTSLQRSFIFDGLPASFEVGRYHSWILSDDKFPGTLAVTARDENGHIMALQHSLFDIQGVQFHPESIMTPVGRTIMENWLERKTLADNLHFSKK